MKTETDSSQDNGIRVIPPIDPIAKLKRKITLQNRRGYKHYTIVVTIGHKGQITSIGSSKELCGKSKLYTIKKQAKQKHLHKRKK